MFIKGQHTYLRALEPSDLDFLFALENDASIWQISNTLAPFSKTLLKQYLETEQHDIYTNKQLRLVICKHQTHEIVGTIDLFDFEPKHGRVGVGILILEPFKKQGFAYDAIETLKKYALETLLLVQLYCNIGAKNHDSIALFERCGFQKIGLKKQWNRISMNEFEDEWIYQVLLA